MDINSQKLIEVFDMINERLYAIEKGNNQIKQHIKNKCMEDGKFDKDFFDYPLDVNIVNINNNKSIDGDFLYVTLSIYEGNASSLFRLCDVEDYNKVRESLPDILNEKQITAVKEYVKKSQLLKEDDEIEFIKCKDIGVSSIFQNIDDYILNEFLKQKYKNLHLICPTFADHYEMILKNVGTLDETIQCVQDIYSFLGVNLHKLSYKSKINIIVCPNNYWVGFEVLLNIPEESCNMEVLLKVYKIDKQIITQYMSCCNSLNYDGYIKNHIALRNKDAVQQSINTFNDIRKKYLL